MKLADHAVEVELLEDAKGQAVRLPKGIRFEGTSVLAHHHGNVVTIKAKPAKRTLRTGEDIREMFRRMDELNAGPAIPGGRGQGTVAPKKIFE